MKTRDRHPHRLSALLGAIALVLATPARADDWPAEASRPPADGFVMLPVPGGCFQMGDFTGQGDANEKPQHAVCVKPFRLGKFPVSQMEWISVMGKNPSGNTSCGGDCPVENVSWNEVADFIRRLNARGDNKYRLPTEAEWEYAARSGGRQETWAGTNVKADLVAYAWFIENAKFQTHPVGQKHANAFGLFDMSGNVWQWTADRYDATYYARSPKQDPTGPRIDKTADKKAGTLHVARGGYWGSPERMLRVTRRIGLPADARSPGFGLRLVQTAP